MANNINIDLFNVGLMTRLLQIRGYQVFSQTFEIWSTDRWDDDYKLREETHIFAFTPQQVKEMGLEVPASKRYREAYDMEYHKYRLENVFYREWENFMVELWKSTIF